MALDISSDVKNILAEFSIKAQCKSCEISITVENGDFSELYLHTKNLHHSIFQPYQPASVSLYQKLKEFEQKDDIKVENEDSIKFLKEEKEESEDDDEEKFEFETGDLDEDYEPPSGDGSNNLEKGDDAVTNNSEISRGTKARKRRKFTVWDHWISLEEGSHECKLCGLIKNTMNTRSLIKHMKEEHSKVWKETNDKREQYYKSRREVEINRPKMESSHGGDPDADIGDEEQQWEEENKMPKIKRSKKVKRVIRQTPYIRPSFLCPDCGKHCINQKQLLAHMSGHTGEFRFYCPYEDCKKGFNWKGEEFNEHVRTHTGEKPHQCSECGERFNRRQGLKIHMAIHTGEFKHICKFCKKTFLQLRYLKDHERSHTGERPFTCDECGKGFVQKTHLKTHMRVHTGDMPYKCDKCDQRFKYLPQRNSHKCNSLYS